MHETAPQTKFVGKSLKKRKKGQGQPVNYESDDDIGYLWGKSGQRMHEKRTRPRGYLWKGIRT